MAKVGNEAKLILRLAAERAKPYQKGQELPGRVARSKDPDEFAEGLKYGLFLYQDMLTDIVQDIEAR